MGFRFYRRIKIIPGITLNVSKSGVSTSVGVKGAHVTLGHGKERTTVGIPGTGASYTEVTGAKRSSSVGGLLIVLLMAIALAFWLI
jgi:hypothetical protein